MKALPVLLSNKNQSSLHSKKTIREASPSVDTFPKKSQGKNLHKVPKSPILVPRSQHAAQHGIRRQHMISIVGCFEPLGIQAGEFNDGEIAASSMSKNFSSTDAWCPPKVDENQYIQVDLSRKTELTKIATQGESGAKDRFVKTFSLLYSDNGKKWEQYGDKGAEKVMGSLSKHDVDGNQNVI